MILRLIPRDEAARDQPVRHSTNPGGPAPRTTCVTTTATSSPAPWWAGALSGLLAAAAGVAVGTAVAALLQGVPSPIESVGNRAIDLAPPALKDFAVQQFGTNDKPVLIGGVVATLALLAAVAGIIGRRRPAIAIGGVAVIGLIAVAAAAVDRTSTASRLLTLVPSVLTVVVSLGSLVLLLSTLTRVRAVPTGPGTVGFVRRDFLKAAAGVTVLVVIGGVVGRLYGTAAAVASRAGITLPRPASPAAPVPAGAQADGRRHQPLRDVEPRLLPRRHGPADPRRAGGGLEPPHPRHGRPRAQPELPRPPRDAAGRAPHHA